MRANIYRFNICITILLSSFVVCAEESIEEPRSIYLERIEKYIIEEFVFGNEEKFKLHNIDIEEYREDARELVNYCWGDPLDEMIPEIRERYLVAANKAKFEESFGVMSDVALNYFLEQGAEESDAQRGAYHYMWLVAGESNRCQKKQKDLSLKYERYQKRITSGSTATPKSGAR